MHNVKEHLKIVEQELRQIKCIIDFFQLLPNSNYQILLSVSQEIDSCSPNVILESYGFLLDEEGIGYNLFRSKIDVFLNKVREKNL